MISVIKSEVKESMISTFNRTKLNSLLQDFYRLTPIRITVFDDQFTELASYPEHIAPFCQIIRTDKEGYENCKKCDRQACLRAAKQRSPYTYRCHAGLTESITPLYLGNIIIGYLLFGHVFAYPSHETGWKIIEEQCRNYKVDKELLKKECFSMPLHSEAYITSASHILEAVASYLCLERMASLRKQELPVQIDEYIQAHFLEDLTAKDIAEKFGIGRTQLYEIAKQNYGTGIAEHIRILRMEKAKQLLEDRSLPLAEIASQCGYKDYNYFITVFKRTVGVTPKKYQSIFTSNRLQNH